ncbi:PucR family transcriptional regulator [Amycolatopsis acidicola]|uniref:PucR family transcriptional regulator n=1 Tax=Amycolatopsis acidicola TaxID=2596893 RepID=A0A5N0VFX3_9PSEU|nr:PucR family transcriptional regulator [Amycolatopsis acidicola]KAA9164508.1 PucR family transcriptional regulator [Amycolatopsis acidicola]
MNPRIRDAVLAQAATIAGAGRARLCSPGEAALDETSVAVPVAPGTVLVVEDPADDQARERLSAFAALASAALGETERLAAEVAAERRLSGLIGGPGGLRALVSACAELSGKVTMLFDAQERLVASDSPPGASPIRLRSLAEIGARDGIAAASLDGLPRRHLVVPATHRGETFGRLVLVEHPSVLRPADRRIAERTACHAGTEFAVQRRVAAVAWNARSSLARQLIRGSSTVDDLRSSGEYLGVDTGIRRVLVYVIDAPPDAEELANALEERLGVEVLATRGSEGILLLVEAAETGMVARVKSAVRAIVGDAVAGVSTPTEPAKLGRAYREAKEVAHCVHRFVGPRSPRVLAVDDLGPARLFVANSAVTAVREYLHDILGPLLTGEPAEAGLLWTLQQFFDCGRSVRVSAARLGVHENTVRLRLARVHQATGLDVAADAGDQLSVQTALLVLRLQGHPALPSLDDSETDLGRKTA